MNSCGDGPRGEPPFTSSYLWKLKRSQGFFSRAPWVKRWFSLDPVSHKLLYWKTADCEARGQTGSTFRRHVWVVDRSATRSPPSPYTQYVVALTTYRDREGDRGQSSPKAFLSPFLSSLTVFT